MNSLIDQYLLDGCGRCKLYATPECKVHTWQQELVLLRKIMLDCGLDEELKWSIPCYTFQENNVVLLSAFQDYCALSFFKGSLLKDEKGILIQQTENVQATRQLRFTNVKEIGELEDVIKAYIFEAIEIEKLGLKVEMKQTADFEIPAELQLVLDENPAFRSAFEALTPGRQRGYLLHFAQPKQSQTRFARIEKCIPKIMVGKGFHDR